MQLLSKAKIKLQMFYLAKITTDIFKLVPKTNITTFAFPNVNI